jgi:hypothetical protein
VTRTIAAICSGLATSFMVLSLGFFLLAAVLRRRASSAPADVSSVSPPPRSAVDDFDQHVADVVANGDRTVFRVSAKGEPRQAIVLHQDGGRV